ncbi:hypothetical protein JCM9279_002360 [Rhodotorula babjevae]
MVGRIATWGVVSTALALGTVLSAFRQRSNFYSAAVYLSKSNACMMILWNQALFHTVLFGKVLQAIFFGELRLVEVERLQERGWFAITETLLALTIFRDDFDSSFVVLFVSLLFLKVFHWLAADRVEAMEQAAQVSRLAHLRMVGLLSLLLLADIGFIFNAADSIMVDGPTVMIMFASEYLILVATALATSAKYVINCIDMRRDTPWEDKSIFVFYVELTADFFKLLTYLVFFGLILTFYGLPLNILRDVYITLRSFILKVRDLRRYRQATRNMDELYPDATSDEMAAMTDRTCIICREDMEYRPAPGAPAAPVEGGAAGPQVEGEPAPAQPPRAGPNDTPKKLPCSHVFHFHCLRSWLERQQSCPTCRRPVLPQEQPPATPPRPGAAALAGAPNVNAEQAVIHQAQVNIARNLGREAFGALFPDVPFPAEAAPPGAAPPAPADPAERLAQPPTAAQAQINAARAPPATPGPAGAAAGPAPSTSAAATLSPPGPTAAPAATAASGDNPLARFSLPSLTVPATGEAGLYHRPPTFAYPPPSTAPGVAAPYADIAYGAYPHFAGTQAHAPSPVGAPGDRRGGMNVEERVEILRRRWGGMAGAPGTSTSTPADGATAAGGQGAEAPREEGVEGEPAKVDKGKGKAVELAAATEGAVDDDDTDLSPRAAALRAAERRAGRTSSASSPAATASASASAQADSTRLAGPAVGLGGVPSPAVRASSATAPLVPRLIPLFDPSNPSPSLANYPALLPLSSGTSSLDARPLLPAMAQLSEAEQLARRGVEERLRLLVGFQERIEGLVGEMRAALDSAPLDGRAGASADNAASSGEKVRQGLEGAGAAFEEARAHEEEEEAERKE